jgi:hypothetical protein
MYSVVLDLTSHIKVPVILVSQIKIVIVFGFYFGVLFLGKKIIGYFIKDEI